MPTDLYEQLEILAERNDRPLYWEARRILIAALKAEGLWPPAGKADTD